MKNYFKKIIFVVFTLCVVFVFANSVLASVTVSGASSTGQYLKCNKTACVYVDIFKFTSPVDPANYYATISAEEQSANSDWATDANPSRTATVCFTVPNMPTGTSRTVNYSVTSSSSGTVLTNSSSYYYINCDYVDAVCGSASTATYTHTGSTTPLNVNLCSAGTRPQTSPILPADQGSFVTWTCAGVNDGDSTTCTARRAVNGVCGTTAKEYSPTDPWSANNYCAVGDVSSTPSNPAQGSSTNWTCAGAYGGTPANCTATRRAPIDGRCGTGATTYAETGSATTISSNLCSAGTSPSAQTLPASGGSTISWTCIGIEGGNPSTACVATRLTNGVCGTAAKSYAPADTFPSGTYCSSGTANPATPSNPAQGGSTSWQCNGAVTSNCTATRRAPINGSCGTSVGTYSYSGYSTTISSNLCSAGTSPGSQTLPASGGSTISWTCAGIEGGNPSTACVATRLTNGVCGTAAKEYSPTDTFPNGTYCLAGIFPITPSNPSQGSSTSWTCVGSGSTASCTATRRAPINASCGVATTPPTTYAYTGLSTTISSNLCLIGNRPALDPVLPKDGGSTISWTCSGIEGGNPANCSALRATNGVCGTANKTYPAGSTGFGTDTPCVSGNPTPLNPVFPTTSNAITSWTCQPVGGGTTATCNANLVVSGSCGTANNKIYSASSTGFGSDTFCALGTPSPANPSFPGVETQWTCQGLNGGAPSAICKAKKIVNGVCSSYTSPPTIWNESGYENIMWYPCGDQGGYSGELPILQAAGGSTVSWQCSGANGGAPSGTCTAIRATNGVCGTANKTYPAGSTSFGSDTFCAKGGVSSTPVFPTNANPASTWSCSGLNGGTPASCSANLVVNGLCGTANKTYPAGSTSFGSRNFCHSGNLAWVPVFPDNINTKSYWACSGLNGGGSDFCTATLKVNGSCGTANNKTYIQTECCPPTWYGCRNTVCPTSYGETGDTQCNAGSPNNTAFPDESISNSTVNWQCVGANGGKTSSSCVAKLRVNASCGSAAKNYSTAWPNPTPDLIITSGLCGKGIGPTSVTLSGTPGSTVIWTCNGINGGSPASCTANRVTDGLCGTANKHLLPLPSESTVTPRSYPNGSTSFGSDTICASGYATNFLAFYNASATTINFPTIANPSVRWECRGSGFGYFGVIGVNSYCQADLAVNGTCPTATTYQVHSGCTYYPVWAWSCMAWGPLSDSMGCVSGTPTSPSIILGANPGDTVSWGCNGINGGNSVNCTATRVGNARCGNIGYFINSTTSVFGPNTAWPTSGFCTVGTPSPLNPSNPSIGGSVNWTCTSGASTVSCSASRVSNLCGSVTTPPSAYYSNTGSSTTLSPACYGSLYPTSVSLPADPGSIVNWYCGDMQCSARRKLDAACGTATRSYGVETFPGTGETYCLYGGLASPLTPSLSTTPGSTTSWTCLGDYNGTNSGICTATRRLPVNGVCGYGTTGPTYYGYDGYDRKVAYGGWYWGYTQRIWYDYDPAKLCFSGGTSGLPGSVVLPPEQGSVVSWTCSGYDGGTDSPPCIAIRATNAICGTANNKTYPAGSTSFGTDTPCAKGGVSSTPVFPTSTNPTTTWTCNGENGGEPASCSAGIVVNAICGTANNKTYPAGSTSFGTDTPCAKGSVSSTPVFPTSTNPTTTWTCNGENGGIATSCSAGIVVNGACSSSTTPPTVYPDNGSNTVISNPCSLGVSPGSQTLSLSSGSAALWKCGGINGGIDSSACTAIRATNGACGTANGKIYPNGSTSFGADTLCAKGTANPATPVFPTDASPTTNWQCVGIAGGTTANCSAGYQSNLCGTASKTYPRGSTSFGTDTFCGLGTVSPVSPAFPTPGGPTTNWTCTSGVVTSNCTANLVADGVCGSVTTPPTIYPFVNNSTSTTIPSTNLCATGVAPASVVLPAAQGIQLTWTCNGANGGDPINCTAIRAANGSCGSAVSPTTAYKYTGVTTPISNNLCDGGFSSNIIPGTLYNYRVSAINPVGTSSASVTSCTITDSTVNGVCGSLHRQVVPYTGANTNYYGTDVCSAGSPSASPVVLPAPGGSTTSWTCSGSTSASCSMTRALQ